MLSSCCECYSFSYPVYPLLFDFSFHAQGTPVTESCSALLYIISQSHPFSPSPSAALSVSFIAVVPCLFRSPLSDPPPPFHPSPFVSTSGIHFDHSKSLLKNHNSIFHSIRSFTPFLTTFTYSPLT